MPPSQSSNKRPATGVPGVKMLITAASVAATVGGWALLSAKEVVPVTQPQSASVVAPQQSLVIRTINLAPLPTLVPPPAQSAVVTVRQPAASNRNQAVAVAPAPAPAAPALPALRVVSAPSPSSGGGGGSGGSAPAPVTTTRSSK